MSVLWCGGEDVDFPNGTATSNGTAGYFRAGYARVVVGASGAVFIRSNPFAGGLITTGWLSFRWYLLNQAVNPYYMCGLSLSTNGHCIMVTSHGTVTSLQAYNGTSWTNLATESGAGSLALASMNRFDVQLAGSSLSSAIVNVFVNGSLVISWSGDLTPYTTTGFDSVSVSNGSSFYSGASEVIVADEDLRSWNGLLTMAPTGAGTTDAWTGAYSTVNGLAISDASPNYVNSNNQDQQFIDTVCPTGVFAIKAIKIAARACKSSASTPQHFQLGYNNGGSNVAFGSSPGSQALTTAYTTYEELDQTDPTNGGAAFTQGELTGTLAGLQLDVRSLA